MKTYKSFALVGLAAVSLFTGQVFATPVCPNTPGGTPTQGTHVCVATSGGDGPGSSLQEQVNDRTVSGPGINVYKDQVSSSAYWSIGATGSSENVITLEMAGNASSNTFGIFDPTNPSNALMLFNGPATTGWSTTLRSLGGGNYIVTYFDEHGVYQNQATAHFAVTNLFGYYLGTLENGTFFSDSSLNETDGSTYPNGMSHMVAFHGDNATTLKTGNTKGLFLSNEWMLAWEDLRWGAADLDYNDFVVFVESVHPVPEPAVLGIFGFGALMIGFAVGLRRRREDV